MAGESTQNNDVWGTLGGGVENVVGKVLDYKLESQRVRTQAAPSGNVTNQGPNPFPGTQSAFPQNDTKGYFSGAANAIPKWAIALIIGAVILLALGFVRR